MSWFILRHPTPSLIDDIFSRRKTVSLTDNERPLDVFDYFIPFCDIHFRSSMSQPHADDFSDAKYEPRLDGEAFRADLHSYVFVYGDALLVDTLVNRSWNKALKAPLRVLREKNGQPMVISEYTMNIFRSAIRQLDFQICEGHPALDEVQEGDEVMVVDGPMKGGEGVVTQIRERQGDLTLTVQFQLFNNLDVRVPGIRLEHVRLRNQEASRLLRDDVISNFEVELARLLVNRHGEHGSVELNKADRRQLEFLNRYSTIDFLDETSRRKFAALMLICAYLMNDRPLIEQRTRAVAELLEGVTEPADDLQCYLMTALFIATHDVTLRQRTKAYRQSHPDCPLAIRRFQSIAKKIKTQSPGR